MTDTISISPKPRIKCFPKNIGLYNTLFYDTAQTKPEKVTELTNEWLWTGGSTYCICNHHVEQHCTIRNWYGRVIKIHCHGSDELCNCRLFRSRSMKISHGGI